MLQLTFLGTRGEIELRTEQHHWHSSLLIRSRRKKIMIDCGLDWKDKVHKVEPDSIVITHAHPDHSWGLEGWNECPVYAPMGTWNVLRLLKWIYGLDKINQKIIVLRKPITIFDIHFEAFPIEHSTRAPAVGYRITSGTSCIFYASDVLDIPNVKSAFKGVQLFIGDGASITRPIVHASGGAKVGHASIKAELEWCKLGGVRRAIFTHCGSDIVRSATGVAEEKVRALSESFGIEAEIAHDGQKLRIS